MLNFGNFTLLNDNLNLCTYVNQKMIAFTVTSLANTKQFSTLSVHLTSNSDTKFDVILTVHRR